MTTATTVNSLRGYDPTEMNFSHVPTSQQQLMPLKQPEQRWRGASSSVSHSRSTSRGRSSSRRRATGSNQNASHVEAGKEQGKENLTKTTGALKKTSLGQLSDSKVTLTLFFTWLILESLSASCPSAQMLPTPLPDCGPFNKYFIPAQPMESLAFGRSTPSTTASSPARNLSCGHSVLGFSGHGNIARSMASDFRIAPMQFQVCRRDDMKATIHVTNESLASQLVNNFGATGHAERPVLTGVKSGQISVTMEHRTALSHTGHEAPVTIMKTVFVGVNIVLVRKLTHYLIHCLV
ncbi:uncharacterized protein [Dermacentor andersoni]|uniref:uncharacterized protein isoform X1 n=1 Tax=Dermacentor andersoni TaxID=34620 RepID=UPI0024166415|nr:uncharacterized protein LOC129381252 isoform X1 [Dermacentor andersoni]